MCSDLTSPNRVGSLLVRDDPSKAVPAWPGLRSALAFLSITALLCLSVEIELLRQIDNLRLYLTLGEIAIEVGIACFISLAIAAFWWLLVMLTGHFARAFSWTKPFRHELHWYLWLAGPLAYLIFDLSDDFKIEVFPSWHPGRDTKVLVSLVLIGFCFAVLYRFGQANLQEFCRTRLVPLAWVHIVGVLITVLILWMHGARFFHDYELAGHANFASNSPDIYFITIDALRADDMSVYGYNRPTTPNLERFAQRSFRFDDFFANSNFTTSATVSIETGKFPWSHRVFQHSGFLRGTNQKENLADILKQRGYYTAMVSSNFLAAPFRHRTMASYDAVAYPYPRGFTGLQLRGSNLIGANSQATLSFSLVRLVATVDFYLDHYLGGDRYPSPPEDAFGWASGFLERHEPGSQPLFLWVHVFPPHEPYWPPPAYRHHFVPEGAPTYEHFVAPDQNPHPDATMAELRAAYDEMILSADHSVGEFLDSLDRSGRLDPSIIVISTDHGELFDHNRLSHGGDDLYNGLIQIPLLIHIPGQKSAGRVEDLCEQVDLLPTLLDLIGASVPNWAEGVSLKPALQGSEVPDRYIFSMNLDRNRIFDPITKGTIAVLDRNFKFVRHLASGKEELYRFRTDSGEEHNLIQSESGIAKRMRMVLMEKLQAVNQHAVGIQ